MGWDPVQRLPAPRRIRTGAGGGPGEGPLRKRLVLGLVGGNNRPGRARPTHHSRSPDGPSENQAGSTLGRLVGALSFPRDTGSREPKRSAHPRLPRQTPTYRLPLMGLRVGTRNNLCWFRRPGSGWRHSHYDDQLGYDDQDAEATRAFSCTCFSCRQEFGAKLCARLRGVLPREGLLGTQGTLPLLSRPRHSRGSHR